MNRKYLHFLWSDTLVEGARAGERQRTQISSFRENCFAKHCLTVLPVESDFNCGCHFRFHATNCVLKLRNSFQTASGTAHAMVDDVGNLSCRKLGDDSKFVRPFRIVYTQDGREKLWDCVLSHRAVAVILFNTTREKLVLGNLL